MPPEQFPLICIEENQIFKFSLILRCFSGTTAEYYYIVTHKQKIQSLEIKCLVSNLKDFL